MPDYTDVSCFLIGSFHLGKIFGMSPFNRKLINGKHVYSTNKRRISLDLILQMAVSFWGCYYVVNVEDVDKTLVVFAYTVVSVQAVITIISFRFQHEYFLKVLSTLRKVDGIMARHFRIQFTYRNEYWFIIALIIVMLSLVAVSEASMTLFKQRPIQTRIGEIITFGCGNVIRLYVLTYFILCVNIVRKHFVALNNLIRNSSNNNADLARVARTCTRLNGCLRDLEHCFGTPLLMILIVNFLACVDLPVFWFHRENTVSLGETIVYIFFYGTQLLIMLNYVERLHDEMRLTCLLIGAYGKFCLKGSTLVKEISFELEYMHVKKNLTVLKLLPLGNITFTEQLSSITNITLFLMNFLSQPKRG